MHHSWWPPLVKCVRVFLFIYLCLTKFGTLSILFSKKKAIALKWQVTQTKYI